MSAAGKNIYRRYLHRIIIDNLSSFGDPIIAKRLVSEIVEYGKGRGVKSILFQLGDPEEVAEAALASRGARLIYERKERAFALGL